MKDNKENIMDKIVRLSDKESILNIIISIDSLVRKLDDRVKVLEEKEADLFTKYYNRDQVDAVSRVLDDKIKALEKFWNKLGCRTKIMSFEDHDYVLSLTSHLPHAVAYSIVKTAINKEDKFKDDVIQYSAGGLRDFTRIAASDPLMWKDIFIDNSENILKVLDNYSKNLNEIKDAIKNKDSKKLLEIFSSTKKVRKEIIEAGQDTDKPGFGRK